MMFTKPMVALTLALAGTAFAAPAPAPIDAEGTIVREANAQREKLTSMELSKSTLDLSTLTDWIGEKPSADAMKDKVVVVAFWSNWIPSNQGLIKRLGAMNAKYADKGLVLIAAHNDERFDKAGAFLSESGAKVLAAKDAGNKLRASLLSDGDPDLYVIDRAGNMRYADIDSGSVEGAIKNLLAETPEQAAGRPAAFIAELKDKKTKAGSTKIVGTGIDPGQRLKVSFTPPDPTLYDKALWPTKNPEQAVSQLGTNIQGQKLPFELGNELWLTEKPAFLGKVVIFDFWATWCVPCKRAMPLLDEMQKSFRDDLTIVGVSGFKFNNGGDEKEDQGEGRPTVEQFLREHNSEYSHAYDVGSKIGKPMALNGIPMIVVCSTDGIVRWQGNPHQDNFRKIVESIITVDPGIAARRKAEKKAISDKGG